MARILIGEPYPEIRELLARVVTGLGFEAVACGSEADGDEDVDVLLLEPGLPDGLELARRLRERNPGLPIVIVSIYPPTPEITALGPVAYLVKPFALADLQRRIVEAVTAAGIPA